MKTELLYVIGSAADKTLTLVETTVDFMSIDNLMLHPNDSPTIAYWQQTFHNTPPLDKLLAWQSLVVNTFPEVSWNAKSKVIMKQTDTEDNPDMVQRWRGTNRLFTVELRGEWKG